MQIRNTKPRNEEDRNFVVIEKKKCKIKLRNDTRQTSRKWKKSILEGKYWKRIA